MVGHGGSSAGSYLADPTSPIPSHCALIVATSTLRVNTTQCIYVFKYMVLFFIDKHIDYDTVNVMVYWEVSLWRQVNLSFSLICMYIMDLLVIIIRAEGSIYTVEPHLTSF